jgi:DNA-binding IclR family transcriptional regulator
VSGAEIPEDVRSFLEVNIEDYEQLEALLLLHADSLASFSPATVASRVGLAPESAVDALQNLKRRGLAVGPEADGSFRLAPPSPQLAQTLERLAHAYAVTRLEVVKLMSANALERLRSAALRTFSDAFVLKRRRDG